ncbi:MAG: hypothetical protein RIE08_00970 [Acidimicrobiales bacterium]
MTRDRLIHYLIVFDHTKGGLIDLDHFDDRDAATAAYAKAEASYRDITNIEIVLVASDSEETIRRTHANYFDGVSPSSSRFIFELPAR